MLCSFNQFIRFLWTHADEYNVNVLICLCIIRQSFISRAKKIVSKHFGLTDFPWSTSIFIVCHFWSIQSLDFNFLGGHFLSKIHWIGPQFFLDLEFRSPQDVKIVLILALTGLRFSTDRFTVTLKGSIRTWCISHARRERPKRISDAFYRWKRRRHNVFFYWMEKLEKTFLKATKRRNSNLLILSMRNTYQIVMYHQRAIYHKKVICDWMKD